MRNQAAKEPANMQLKQLHNDISSKYDYIIVRLKPMYVISGAHNSVIFILIYFLVLVLVFQLFFRFSFVLVFIIFSFSF